MSILVRNQLWHFRDGREGIVASVNTIGATFYVGPQSFMVPTGDIDAALYGATLVNAHDAAHSHQSQLAMVVEPAPAPTPVAASTPVAPEHTTTGPLVIEVTLPEPAPSRGRGHRERKAKV